MKILLSFAFIFLVVLNSCKSGKKADSNPDKITVAAYYFANYHLNNDTLHLKLDLTRGGAINYISKSVSNRSIVNIADEGRYIQQSYYAGKTLNRIADGTPFLWLADT